MRGVEGRPPLPGDQGVRNISYSWTQANPCLGAGLGKEVARLFWWSFMKQLSEANLADTVAVEEMVPTSETPQCSLDIPTLLMTWLPMFSVMAKSTGSTGREPALSHSSGTSCDLVGLL